MTVNWSYRVEGDDTTRTASVYDGVGALIETRPYTERENQAADQRVEIAVRVTGLEERVLRLEDLLLEHEPDPTEPDDPSVLDWEDLPRGLWFHDTLVRDGGAVWRNISGTPLSERPTAFPGGTDHWTHLFVKVVEATDPPPDPDPEPGPDAQTWAPDVHYLVGNQVVWDGRLWEAKTEHTSHDGWKPSVDTYAVWEDLGPYPPE